MQQNWNCYRLLVIFVSCYATFVSVKVELIYSSIDLFTHAGNTHAKTNTECTQNTGTQKERQT